MHFFLFLLTLCIFISQYQTSQLPLKASITAKENFLKSLSMLTVDGNSKNTRQKEELEENFKSLVASPLNSLANSGFVLREYDFGCSEWKVTYAPHITLLSQFLFTSFSVFYKFDSSNNIISNVKYSSKVFGCGWLNTKGTVSIIDQTVCDLVWQQIWWDWSSDKPSSVDEREKHLLPDLIQLLGLAAFIKSASVFPVKYIDDDLCVFSFPLTGTVICAQKI